MSVEPDTPDSWRTITIQGAKCGIGPDAVAGDVLGVIRELIASKRLQVPGGTAARHAYTGERYALVRKETVGMDGDEWGTPESRKEIVPWDLSTVEDGDHVRGYSPSGAEWFDGEPVYEEAADHEFDNSLDDADTFEYVCTECDEVLNATEVTTHIQGHESGVSHLVRRDKYEDEHGEVDA